jgi:hypothetical protein
MRNLYNLLTESGIEIPDEGKIIKGGRVVELGRQLKRLYEDKEFDKFENLVRTARNELDEEYYDILSYSRLSESTSCVARLLDKIETDNIIAGYKRELTKAGISFTDENVYEAYAGLKLTEAGISFTDKDNVFDLYHRHINPLNDGFDDEDAYDLLGPPLSD